MSEIKVGQVYDSDEGIYTITKIWIDNAEEMERADVVYNDGTTDNWSFVIIKYSKLIAEYPTWQEAVNSKEFNNTVNDTVNDTVRSENEKEN